MASNDASEWRQNESEDIMIAPSDQAAGCQRGLGDDFNPPPSGENILWTQRIEKEAGPGNGYGMVLVFWFAKCSLSRQACWWNVEYRWMMMNVEVWDFFNLFYMNLED